MIYIIGRPVAILVIYLFIKGVKYEQENNLKSEIFQMEAPDRIRIYNDSIKLIENTKNINTFISRIVDIDDFLEWGNKQYKKGNWFKVKGQNILQLKDNAYYAINKGAIRIALLEYNKWMDIEQKSGKRFDTATAKTFEILDKLPPVLKPAPNKNSAQEDIEKLRNKIELIYSEL